MTTLSELRTDLVTLAERSVNIMSACRNEESTKLYLILPFVGLLGFDHLDPHEVSPEHRAGFSDRDVRKVDIAVFYEGEPAIAIECKKADSNLDDDRGQLRGYFNALLSVKVGILTNGIQYDFFIDSEERNMMDEEPFLSLDLASIAHTGVSDEIVDALSILTKSRFDGKTIADIAHSLLTKKRLRSVFIQEARKPSEEFCRFALDKVGVRNRRKSSIDRLYAPLVKAAFEESLILPVAENLRLNLAPRTAAAKSTANPLAQRIVTTERELELFDYVRRRLAYLVTDQTHFDAIEDVKFKDQIGKLVVFFDRKRKGWMFDYLEGNDGCDKYVFPEPFGEIITDNVQEIDTALKATFLARVREQSSVVSPRVQQLSA